LLHFVLPFFFAQNSTFATSSFSGSGQPGKTRRTPFSSELGLAKGN
jgi:hypothetical protein